MPDSRKVYMVQRRVHGAGGQLAAIDPNLGHWGVDVMDDACGITRFEAFTTAGKIVLSVVKGPSSDEYKRLRIPAVPNGTTQMSDDQIKVTSEQIIAANPRYSLAVNNCQTFAMLLMDEILESNSVLGKFNAWQMRLLRNFA